MATKENSSNSGETINRLLNVSIRSRAHPVTPGRKAATEAVSSSQALLFPVLEVQTSFAVLPRNHRLMAVKVNLHTPDYRQGNVIVHAYARDAATRLALCATSRDRCPHQGRSCRLIAGLTKMRVTSLSWAAADQAENFSLPQRGDEHIHHGRLSPSARARAARRSSEFFGSCRKISTSSPVWWLA